MNIHLAYVIFALAIFTGRNSQGYQSLIIWLTATMTVMYAYESTFYKSAVKYIDTTILAIMVAAYYVPWHLYKMGIGSYGPFDNGGIVDDIASIAYFVLFFFSFKYALNKLRGGSRL